MTTYKILRKLKVKTGWDVTVELTGDTGEKGTNLFNWPFEVEPDDKMPGLISTLEKICSNFDEGPVKEPPTVLRTEIDELLVKKGYLTQGQTLADLPDAGDIDHG